MKVLILFTYTAFLIALLSAAVIFVCSYFIEKKRRSFKNTTFDELISILQLVVNTELDEYDREIFARKGTISNQNYDSFYNDISNKIIEHLSPTFIAELAKYTTEDNIYILIARRVKAYLKEKIASFD